MGKIDLQVYHDGGLFHAEGGNRTHIYDWEQGKCLCGTTMLGSCTLVDVTKKWLDESSGDELCKRCERKARKLLNKINEL